MRRWQAILACATGALMALTSFVHFALFGAMVALSAVRLSPDAEADKPW